MKLRDGTPFSLGMKVVFENGREVETSPETHEIDTFVVEGITIHSIKLKSGCGGIDLKLLYPHQRARIESQISRLEAIKEDIDEEIQYLREGGNSDRCRYLDPVIL